MRSLKIQDRETMMTEKRKTRRKMLEDIKNLRLLNTYRGTRHAMRLPVRGQRTRCNAHTAKKKIIS